MMSDDYRRLARLLLLELDATTRDELRNDARFANAANAVPDDLDAARIEFTRLFSLSVYPYASVFCDDVPAINGESSASVEQFYERVGFEIKREWMVGAPDALGAELACVAYLIERRDDPTEFLRDFVLPWAPVCCFALERNAPGEFYRTVARATKEFLLNASEKMENASPSSLRSLKGNERDEAEWDGSGKIDDRQEKDLHSIVDYLTTPARSGIFLSKNEMRMIAGSLDLPISFGERGLMLTSLLRSAGLSEHVSESLDALREIVGAWQDEYAHWMHAYSHATIFWQKWHTRTQRTLSELEEMARLVLIPLDESVA